MADQLPVTDEIAVETKRSAIEFSLTNFLNQDLVRSCKFAASFPNLPWFLNSKYRYSVQNLSTLVDSIEFPGMTVNATEYRPSGMQKIKSPMFKDYNEVTLSMYYPSEFSVFSLFADWIDGISPSSNQNSYFDEITASYINLYQYSDMAGDNKRPIERTNFALDNILLTKLVNVYPTSLQSMPCSWSDEGFQKVSVTLFFEHAIIVPQKVPVREDVAVNALDIEIKAPPLDMGVFSSLPKINLP